MSESDQSVRPKPKPGVLDIAAYVPGGARLGGTPIRHMLASNETPLGPSEKAVEAYRANASALRDYPDGSASELRVAIAELYGLNADRIVCGNGSDELISLLAATYLAPGDEAIHTAHGFLMYRISTLAAGGTPVVVPETADLRADVDAILAAVTPRTRLVFLANPNNPTGTYLPFDEIRRLQAGLPADVVLVLDAAYAEYIRRNDYESGIELVATTSNTVMTRTFSKVYGLANLRLGWCYAPPEIADALNRMRGPFNVTGAAVAAGTAAIRDRSTIEKALEHNDHWNDWLTRQLTEIGLRVTPSVANFVLVHFPDDAGRRAEDADRALMDAGILVRRVVPYGFENALRITVGLEEANREIVSVLSALMQHKGGSHQ